MRRTRIKICGVCHPEDAALAAECGADAVGMVFHGPSARNVTIERAREIIAALGPFVMPVGLFVDADSGAILDTVGKLGLRCVQLNGRETPETVSQLRGLAVIKAIRVEATTFQTELSRWRDARRTIDLSPLRAIVVETARGGLPGGSGLVNDFAAVRAAIDAGAFAGVGPLIAAGGLTGATVASVVRDLRPWAVDVSSGVEDTPCRKSREKLTQFFASVGAADRM